MNHRLILDTGPWVALLCRDDTHHEWAKAQFAQHPGPFLTCEAVVAETCFLLARAGFDPARALMLLERGAVQIALSLESQIAPLRKLFEPCSILTLDSDFGIYRRHGRKTIPVISPHA